MMPHGPVLGQTVVYEAPGVRSPYHQRTAADSAATGRPQEAMIGQQAQRGMVGTTGKGMSGPLGCNPGKGAGPRVEPEENETAGGRGRGGGGGGRRSSGGASAARPGQIVCRYGQACTRPGCWYLHPTGRAASPKDEGQKEKRRSRSRRRSKDSRRRSRDSRRRSRGRRKSATRSRRRSRSRQRTSSSTSRSKAARKRTERRRAAAVTCRAERGEKCEEEDEAKELPARVPGTPQEPGDEASEESPSEHEESSAKGPAQYGPQQPTAAGDDPSQSHGQRWCPRQGGSRIFTTKVVDGICTSEIPPSH